MISKGEITQHNKVQRSTLFTIIPCYHITGTYYSQWKIPILYLLKNARVVLTDNGDCVTVLLFSDARQQSQTDSLT